MEQRYSPIEKEMLAVTWSVEKFHRYTYWRHTMIRSDHKPLERIIIKPLKDIPRRLQGFQLRLQNYDIAIQYKQDLSNT